MHNDGKLDSVGLAARTPNPSFLAVSHDKKYLVSISEVSAKDHAGMVKSYRIVGDRLKEISVSSSGGGHPCFVGINEKGDVVVANYSGGSVALYRLNMQGKLSEVLDVRQHKGSGTTSRQKSPHAHSAWFDPVSNHVIGVDLGTNELWIYVLDSDAGKLVPADPPTLSMEPGAGPRHLVFHPGREWVYVVNELNATVTRVVRDGRGHYQVKESYSTLPADFTGHNTCADIHVSADGKYVYASNRGHNSLAIFKVDQEDGMLAPAKHASVHGETPRNFAISPCGRYVLVANQDSENIVSFRRDMGTGQLIKIDEIDAPKPVCIKFL